MPNAVAAAAQRARCGYIPCPVAGDPDASTEQSQHQGRALLTLLLSGIARLEEIKDAFGPADNWEDLGLLLLFHK